MDTTTLVNGIVIASAIIALVKWLYNSHNKIPYTFGKFINELDAFACVTYALTLILFALGLCVAYVVNDINKPLILLIPIAIILFAVVFVRMTKRIYDKY
jgi:hypothetical protein